MTAMNKRFPFGEGHAHIFMNGADYHRAVETHKNSPDERVIRLHLQEYQKRGISFVRDGGDHFGASFLARKLAPEYGITYLTPGAALFKKGHYGRVVGEAFEDMKEFAALVKERKRQGADFIKIMTTGIMDFQTDHTLTGRALREKEVFEMVHIAHEEGFLVMSHTNGARACEIAAACGADSLEHGNFQDEQSLRVLAECGTLWVPTVVTVKNLIGCGRYPDRILERIWERTGKMLKAARALGVSLALGSDAGACMVGHGSGLLDEFRAFQEVFPEDKTLISELERGQRKLECFVRQ